ncbi:hypothetical protein HAX54_035957 [Datura stramonium]|uniref:RNase H type-1 domain-containing protein n=1 Tax=Datura stramonium TaxID=4076 RepID=A0ABS8SG03_DATST|nr:hypothetical protein [Datura stramonium]
MKAEAIAINEAIAYVWLLINHIILVTNSMADLRFRHQIWNKGLIWVNPDLGARNSEPPSRSWMWLRRVGFF